MYEALFHRTTINEPSRNTKNPVLPFWILCGAFDFSIFSICFSIVFSFALKLDIERLLLFTIPYISFLEVFSFLISYFSFFLTKIMGDYLWGETPRNPVMQFLISECWTDGSIMSLKEDVISGITLAITQVAPSVAFSLMGGGPPLAGLFSSFFLGSISCALGGRPGQITAIAGAVVVLYPDLIGKHGYDAVCVVSIITGILHFVLGLLRVSRHITLLPATVMIGFCNGLAISMATHQIESFKDVNGNYPYATDALYVSVLCIVTYMFMMLMPLFTNILPSTFVAIIVGTAINYIFQLKTTTIGDLYDLKGTFPAPKIPDVPWSSGAFWKDIMQSSVLTFIIAAVESFLSDYKIQQMTETLTNFDREAWALGAGLVVNGFFQGMPGCVVFGPCVLNIESGTGTRRTAAFICAVLMAVVPLALYPVIRLLPMPVLAAVVFGVSSKTADWRMIAMIVLQRISLQEAAVCLVVTVVTLFTDLAVATGCGFGVALVCFMWNMSRGRVSMLPHLDQMTSLNGALAEFAHRGSLSIGREDAENVPSGSRDVPSSPPDGLSSPRGSGDEPVHEHRVSFALPVPSLTEAPVLLPLREREMNTKDTSKEEIGAVDLSDEDERYAPMYHSGNIWSPEDDSGGAADGGFRTPGSPGGLASRGRSRNVSLSCSIRLDVPNTSMAGKNFMMNVNFLNIEEDAVFPQIKVLRVKMSGVLFFGSCTDFVDNMMVMLHTYHSQLFLRVTDFIFDFQSGLMPVMDYSAAEALEIAALTLAKRGIRVHLHNLDPESEVCVDRARRYLPHLCDDNVDNLKNICYARRVFNRGAGTHHQDAGENILDDNVFTTVEIHATRSLASGVLRATDEVLSFENTIKIGFPVYREEFGITAPVFDTLKGWKERLAAERQSVAPSQLDKGITGEPAFDRRYGDIGPVWWQRLRNQDLRELQAGNRHRTIQSYSRPVPTRFFQVPRFPGQGYAKHEQFSRSEWAAVQRSVLKLWDVDDPREALGCCSERMVVAMNKLIDGFMVDYISYYLLRAKERWIYQPWTITISIYIFFYYIYFVFYFFFAFCFSFMTHRKKAKRERFIVRGSPIVVVMFSTIPDTSTLAHNYNFLDYIDQPIRLNCTSFTTGVLDTSILMAFTKYLKKQINKYM
eukprot:gene6045-4346_t